MGSADYGKKQFLDVREEWKEMRNKRKEKRGCGDDPDVSIIVDMLARKN
jgi:hypothetical protein